MDNWLVYLPSLTALVTVCGAAYRWVVRPIYGIVQEQLAMRDMLLHVHDCMETVKQDLVVRADALAGNVAQHAAIVRTRQTVTDSTMSALAVTLQEAAVQRQLMLDTMTCVETRLALIEQRGYAHRHTDTGK